MLTDPAYRVPNLYALVDEASKNGNELEACSAGTVGVRVSIELAIENLTRELSGFGDSQIDRPISIGARLMRASVRNDVVEQELVKWQAYQLWRKRFNAVERAAKAIAFSLETAGDAASSSRWLDRVHACGFPLLFQQESTDFLHEWALSAEVDPSALARLAETYDEFSAHRRTLRDRAMDTRLQVRAALCHRISDTTRYDSAIARKNAVDEQRRMLCDRYNNSIRSTLTEQSHKDILLQQLRHFREQTRPTSHESPP